MKLRTLALFGIFLVACQGSVQGSTVEPKTPTSSNPAVSVETPAEEKKTPELPKLRLTDGMVMPVRYRADLSIDPNQEEFEGSIKIEVKFAKKTDFTWLNATNITVKNASLWVGKEKIAAKTVEGDKDFFGLSFARPVEAGPATIELQYTGKLAEKETRGLFRQKEGGEWYVLSHFEPLSARKAFPSFDQPSFKVPWQVSLRIPKDMKGFSNTEKLSEKIEGDKKVLTFKETKPLPSYLIALAVGPFETVDAGQSKMSNTPIRIIVPRGKTAEARFSAKHSAAVLDRLEEYFGTPYPFGKMDQIVIPETNSFGAMENPGLITYNGSILLAKPEDETISFQRRFISIAAHEIAHQWFGNLVTHAWWDDIWLNEAMASWMDDKISEEWNENWQVDIRRISSRVRVMGSDSLVTARRIRQPIVKRGDIRSAFDGITYTKGAAVLSMFEIWVGKEPFRKAIRSYLKKHSYGNATATDFLASLSEVAGTEVGSAFSTFLDQAGVPLLSTSLQCKQGKTPTLSISQQRFLPAGSQGGNANQYWQVPVCVKYGTGRNTYSECKLIKSASDTFQLSKTKKCPDWVLPNQDGLGYYLVDYQDDLLAKLYKHSTKKLSSAERVAFLGDIAALTERGDISLGDALAMLPTFLKKADRHVVFSSLRILGNVHTSMISDDLQPSYKRFIKKLFARRAKTLDLSSKRNEKDDAKLLRPTIIRLVALGAEDKTLIDKSIKLARRWISDRKAIQSDMEGTVLSIAARYGDRTLFEAFLAEAKKTEDRRERRRLLGALGSFWDQELIKEAFALVLTDEFEGRDAMSIVWAAVGERKNGEYAYQFVKDNFDALVKRLPENYGSNFPFAGSNFCDQEHYDDLKTFFEERVSKFDRGPRRLKSALERMRLCISYRKLQEQSVATFLKAY